jgi:ABC-type molybdate transport system substrate-binding protein
MKRLAALVALAAVAASSAGATTKDSRLTVFAAASLTRVLPQLDKRPAYQFAGTNTLALQIEQGAPADVFVSAVRSTSSTCAARACSSGSRRGSSRTGSS